MSLKTKHQAHPQIISSLASFFLSFFFLHFIIIAMLKHEKILHATEWERKFFRVFLRFQIYFYTGKSNFSHLFHSLVSQLCRWLSFYFYRMKTVFERRENPDEQWMIWSRVSFLFSDRPFRHKISHCQVIIVGWTKIISKNTP